VAETNRIQFRPTKDERTVPERFRLEPHQFESNADFIRISGPVEVFKVTFPSPVETKSEANNTVHAEYYLPAGEGPFPAVVVLHILGGEFPLSQMVANSLARKQVAALFIKMPYYGERRAKGNKRRMISRNPEETVEGMTQAVLDIRRGAAWLCARPEVDAERMGVTGISLGGIMTALSAPAEPRFRKAAIYLGGGNLAQFLWDKDHPEAEQFRGDWKKNGGTRESFIALMKPVDPITYGHLLRSRDVLMVAASHDEIIPPEATKALYRAIGEKPELVWLDSGHITASKYIFGEVVRMQRFFTHWHEGSAKSRKGVKSSKSD
jgi:dienelactone hydrolase